VHGENKRLFKRSKEKKQLRERRVLQGVDGISVLSKAVSDTVF